MSQCINKSRKLVISMGVLSCALALVCVSVFAFFGHETIHDVGLAASHGLVFAISVLGLLAFRASPLRTSDFNYAVENLVCMVMTLAVATVGMLMASFEGVSLVDTFAKPVLVIAVGMCGTATWLAKAFTDCEQSAT